MSLYLAILRLVPYSNSVFFFFSGMRFNRAFFYTFQIHAHYFEDGNVQLQSSREFPATEISFTNNSEFTEAVILHIKVSFESYILCVSKSDEQSLY